MKYAPCRFVSLKLQPLQSAAVKLLRLKSCATAMLQTSIEKIEHPQGLLPLPGTLWRQSKPCCIHTSPWKSRPLKSASPNCCAVPFPNSPPAAASYLFKSARAGGLRHKAALKTAAVPAFLQFTKLLSVSTRFADATTMPGCKRCPPPLDPFTFQRPDLKISLEPIKLGERVRIAML